MPRYGNHGPKSKEGNITWGDVAALLQQMEGHLGMRVHVRHYVETGPQGEPLHKIAAEAFTWEALTWHQPKHRVVLQFPHSSVATMPGAYVRALHSLDHVAWRQAELPEG